MDTRQELAQKTREEPAIIGNSFAADKMRNFAERAARSTEVILLTGETGVGKDHLAEYIHWLGGNERPFVPVDCGTIPHELIESELFGHLRGSFTGAHNDKEGLVMKAEGGTLFLNEIGNLPYGLQSKILRLTEGKSFRQVGGSREFSMNTRLIAGTNAQLATEVRDQKFRSDLYYRLNRIAYKVPPLRERWEDIPILAEHFLTQTSSGKRFSNEALALMGSYEWPGNIRELQAVVGRGVFHSDEEEEIGTEHVEPYLEKEGVSGDESYLRGKLPKYKEYKRRYFVALLRDYDTDTKRSRVAGIPRTTVNDNLHRFGLRDKTK